jgi:hypothetical protein
MERISEETMKEALCTVQVRRSMSKAEYDSRLKQAQHEILGSRLNLHRRNYQSDAQYHEAVDNAWIDKLLKELAFT